MEVLFWIEQVTGLPYQSDPSQCRTSGDFCELLKSGVHLCKYESCSRKPRIFKFRLITVLNPTYRMHYTTNPRMPFHKMENISNFLEACKAYGVPEISCFQTVDLYEDKQTYKVIECLRGVASLAQSRRPDLEFPAWVVRMAKSHPRQFPESVMRRGEMVIPLQYGTNKCASQKGMTPYGLARQIKPDPFG
ncbi:hypothetical protein WR25_00314 isoform B [Diploscapter pachys]|uniref:Transgelin n=1 Tax=Diploscapter pachys TaxID=2018661 RepID=A0A2A2L0B6_9BILA|nr:hypothetical protein WR25_00314 isoform B [Diploscapter pachys]